MSIKAVWKDDIRRFKIDLTASDAFDQLLAGILRLFKQPSGSRFVVRYLDDENELITVTSTEELQEAQRVATETGRNLKFILEKQDDDQQEDVKKVATVDVASASAAATGDAVLLSKAAVAALASVAPASAPAPEPTPVPTISADEIVQLFMNMLQQEWAMSEIEAACDIAKRGISESAPIESIVSTILAERKQLAATELAQRLQPLWPAIFAAARSFNFSIFKIAKMVSFVPQLLRACERPCLAQILGNVVRGNFTNFENIENDAIFIDVEPGVGLVPPSAPAAAAAAPAGDQVVHDGVTCDMCEASPIVGVRYKCQRCPDFDMCEACEAKGAHPADHILLKIMEPAQRGFGAWRSMNRWRGGGCRRFQNGHAHEHRDRVPRCEFVSDDTIPDHSEVAPGSVLSKVWMVKNPTSTVWPDGVRVVYLNGAIVPAAGEAYQAPVKSAAAGEIVPVAVDVRCPDVPGRAVGNFRLQLPSGVFFGHRLWVTVDVTEKAETKAAEPVPELALADTAAPELALATSSDADTACFATQPNPAPVQIAAEPLPEVVAAAAAPVVAAPAEPSAPVASAPVAPVAPAAPVEADLVAKFKDFKYPKEMLTLHQLGFTNTDLNMYVLQNKRGNLQSCVEWLLTHS